MTRYTKLERKKHDNPATGAFDVKPLLPKKPTEGGGSGYQGRGEKRKPYGRVEKNTNENDKRKKRRDLRKEKGTVCFGCRKTGHSVGNCPEAKQSGQGICYNCGTTEHSLKNCKKPRKGNELPFAKCFVCKAQGHLSGQCPENSKGLYPNGGGCRFCGKVDHLAKDCGTTKEEAGTTVVGKINLDQGADDDDYHIFVNEKQKVTEEVKEEKKLIREVKAVMKQSRKVVKF